jgi:hypothetical protein
VETADHTAAFLPYFLHNVRVQQVQLDELFALFSVIKDGTISETEAIARLDRSPHEVWAAMDPESKLWLASDLGERTLAIALRFVQHVTPVLAPDCAPLWLTDGFREYLTAWVTLSDQWVQPYRRQAPGPMPKLRWWPQPGLLYAQVRKQYHRRRLVGMCPRVVFGTRDAVHAVLAPLGWQINTAFIERLHLDMRQHVAALGRRLNTLCKHDAGLRQQ